MRRNETSLVVSLVFCMSKWFRGFVNFLEAAFIWTRINSMRILIIKIRWPQLSYLYNENLYLERWSSYWNVFVVHVLASYYFLWEIQSTATITWSNINMMLNAYITAVTEAEYFRVWTHQRHHIPRPNGRAMGCLLRRFWRKLTAL